MPDRYEFRIAGLDQFIRTLRLAPQELVDIDNAYSRLAGITIVEKAIALAKGQGSVMAKSAVDIKLGRGDTSVVYGGNAYNFGAEFGSYRYKQFQAWRGNTDSAGYFLWPTVRLFRDHQMTELWIQEAWEVLKQAFPTE